jgi:hypothetical protein
MRFIQHIEQYKITVKHIKNRIQEIDNIGFLIFYLNK